MYINTHTFPGRLGFPAKSEPPRPKVIHLSPLTAMFPPHPWAPTLPPMRAPIFCEALDALPMVLGGEGTKTKKKNNGHVLFLKSPMGVS